MKTSGECRHTIWLENSDPEAKKDFTTTTLHHISYITSHCITLHYITLHYIPSCPESLPREQGRPGSQEGEEQAAPSPDSTQAHLILSPAIPTKVIQN